MAQYQSFLLRVWCSSRPTGLQWSAQLEGLQDGGRLRFADLDALLTYLRTLLDPATPSSTGPPD